MQKLIDETGKIYGRLTVIKRTKDKRNKTTWLCKCTCGNETTVIGTHLRSGDVKSCGCLNREQAAERAKKHGMSKTDVYKSWCHMKERCLNKLNKDYLLYGGRGITICDRWLESFENFYNDMGSKPSSNHSLDRIDVNGDYGPSNCRWATQKEQVINRRLLKNARLISPSGIRYVVKAGYIKEFCYSMNLSQSAISFVLNRKRDRYKNWTGCYL